MNNELIEYVRKNVNGKIQKVGVLYGWSEIGNVGDIKIGWSKVNTKMNDKFDPVKGLVLATNRSRATTLDTLPKLPSSMKNPVKRFEKRCLKYFKGKFLNFVLVDFMMKDLNA